MTSEGGSSPRVLREHIVLPPAVRRSIAAHARRAAPHECCGFLLGCGRRISHALAMRNVARNPATRYRIDDREHIDVRRTLRRLHPALQIVGVYHSHPRADPAPSPTDIVEALYPEWAHVIVGVRNGRARLAAFRIAEGRAREIQVR